LFTRAIVRTPAKNFADGITTAGLGKPDYALALDQHAAYVRALESCGLKVTVLEPDPEHPDSTFVEDAAVIFGDKAVLARPGAASRSGEVSAIRKVIEAHTKTVFEITSPGTLDGGDICEADGNFFVGISHRTNEEGVRQLSGFLRAAGYSSSLVDIRSLRGILHLKSGIAHLGDQDLVLWPELAEFEQFRGYNKILVDRANLYAANCVRVNDRVLVAGSFPKFAEQIERAGYKPLPVEVSEFQKMDGGLSCLSLRF
jgi:dimethylargininase